MKRICLYAAILTALACGGGGGGGNTPPVDPGYISKLRPAVEAKVDQVMRDAQFEQNIPGISVGVVQGGEVVLVKGYGSADISAGTPIDANTPFEIGSCTKSFTAFGILRILDDPTLITKPGITAIDLDEPVKTYLEGSPNIVVPATWNAITVRQLLTMTSGIPDGSSNTAIWQVVVAEAAGKPLGFTPGTGYCYSNPGYMVLGEVIQQLTGMAYADFMAAYVFAPLGLTNTFIHSPSNTPATLAKGYSWNGTVWEEPAPRSPLSSFSSGAVITTAGDLAKFLLALEQKKVLKADTYVKMFTPFQLPSRDSQWGFGWNCVLLDPLVLYRKDGGLPGYSAQMSIYKSEGVCIAVCTNLTNVATAELAAKVGAAIKEVDFLPNPAGPLSDCD